MEEYHKYIFFAFPFAQKAKQILHNSVFHDFEKMRETDTGS